MSKKCQKISDTLISNGRKNSVHTIDEYINALIESYIIYKVNRFDIKGKQLLKTQGKYYFVDNGLKNVIDGLSYYDSGSSLENLIYIELLRRRI